MPIKKTTFNRKIARAFTLVELLLYIGLVGIIMLSVSIFYFETLQARVKNQTVSEVEMQGTLAMEKITQTIRNADVINSPAVGLSAASISLATITPTTNPTLFDLSSGILRITEGANPAVNLTTDKVAVSALNFQNLSSASTPGVVKITFTITYINNAGRNEYDFSKTFTGAASLR